MYKLLSFLLVSAMAFGQAVVVGSGTQSTTLTVVPKSTTTFSFPSVAAAAGGAATLNVQAATTRVQVQPIALAFQINWPAADVTGVSVANGPALTGTGKSMNCIPNATGTKCTVSGGSTIIPDGTVAVVSLTANKSTNLSLSALSSTNKFGVALLTAANPGGAVTVASQAVLASISCASAQIESGEDVVCTSTLNQAAPVGGVVVQLSSSDPATVRLVSTGGATITTITIPAGAVSAQFVARGV